MRGFWTLGALAALALAGCGGGSSEAEEPAAPAGYRFVQVASGLESPVHVSAPRNQPGRLYVVEQEGRIRIVQNGRITGTLLDIRSQVQCCGEQGLLSVAFHPRYARNGKYYVNYTDNRGDTRVVEYRGKRRLRQVFFVAQPYSNHNGGQSAFGADGLLYVGTGDGGAGGDPENRAQNLGSRLGKMLAVNVDRRAPRPRLVGYGLRNPWRFSFDRRTGDLYIGDVGQNSWEEVNVTRRRSPGVENYGWDVYEGRARFENKQPSGNGQAGLPRRRLSAWRRALRGQRRLRLPRFGGAGCGRPLLLRRQLLRDRLELPSGARAQRQTRAVHPRRPLVVRRGRGRASFTRSRSTAACTSCAPLAESLPTFSHVPEAGRRAAARGATALSSCGRERLTTGERNGPSPFRDDPIRPFFAFGLEGPTGRVRRRPASAATR